MAATDRDGRNETDGRLSLDVDTVAALWSKTYNTAGKPDWSHIYPYYHPEVIFQEGAGCPWLRDPEIGAGFTGHDANLAPWAEHLHPTRSVGGQLFRLRVGIGGGARLLVAPG